MHSEEFEAIEYGLLFYADPNTPSEGCPVADGWLDDDLHQPPPYDLAEWVAFGNGLTQEPRPDEVPAGTTSPPSGVPLAGGDVVMQRGDPTAPSVGAASSGAPLANAGGEDVGPLESHPLLGPSRVHRSVYPAIRVDKPFKRFAHVVKARTYTSTSYRNSSAPCVDEL